MFSHTAGSVRVVKLLMRETGTYNPQFRRPYQTHVDGNNLAVLNERLAGDQAFQPAMLAGVANQFIEPSAAWEKQLTIANGWDYGRIRFQMEVEVEFRTGGKLTVIVLGYTNHVGVTPAGTYDSNMEFYVNSILHLRQTLEHTPLGNQMHVGIADNSHIIVNPSWEGVYGQNQEQRMRPEDVFASISRSHLNLEPGEVIDERTSNTSTAVKSRRNNNMAPNYMANILHANRLAHDQAQMGQTHQQILSQSRGIAIEASAQQDPFLAAINNIRGTVLGNTFTWGDLNRLDPNVQRNTRTFLNGPAEKAAAHFTGMTAGWEVANRLTQVATILAQSVPGLMMDLLLTKTAFVATNRVVGKQVNITMASVDGFTNIDLTPYTHQFMARMEHEILRDITFGNQIDFYLSMTVDLLGEVRITLALDGQPNTDFCFPAFCDALAVPVLTHDFNRAQNLADNFDSLTTVLMGNCDGGFSANPDVFNVI